MTEILSLPHRLMLLALALLVWLAIYFIINRIEVDPGRRLDLGTSLDRRIPFAPLFAPAYFSTYIFVLLPFILLTDARRFYWMLASFSGITVLSSLIHASIPSRIERVEDVNSNGMTGRMLGFFQRICKPYGNFPSMHVGLSVPVIAAFFMAGGAAAGYAALPWAILIALSTLFTKQHYILDVLAGLVIGITISGLTYQLMPA